jgi:hypothetical protein
MYIIQSGTVEISQDKDGKKTRSCTHGEGRFFRRNGPD